MDEELEADIAALAQKLSDPGFLSNAREAKKAGAELHRLEKKLALRQELERMRRAEANSVELQNDADPILRGLAKEEAKALEEKIASLERELNAIDSPASNSRTAHDAIFEIRAGTGGEEAALFAKDLFEMYAKYAGTKGWRVENLSESRSELGGVKEIIFEIRGEDAFGRLAREAGVHRIQRIPQTEKQGRIHTSTASVAIFPKAEEADVEIRPQDLKIDFFRSSGPGGQNANKVESAVRITHLPTGLVIASQEGRSQQKNREGAMSILRSKLLAAEREREEMKMAKERRSQIGSAERAEKIRTYNIPQDRVTDHRLNRSWHNIESIFAGKIDEITASLADSAAN